jgi:hypothetical protein
MSRNVHPSGPCGDSCLYELIVYWYGGHGRHTSTSRYEGISCTEGCSAEASASFAVANWGWEADGADLMVTKDVHSGSRDRHRTGSGFPRAGC